MFRDIAIFGLGLLGGSLCRDARELIPGVRISAFGRDLSRLNPALKDGSVDFAGLYDQAEIKGKDLIAVCTPVASSIPRIKRILSDPMLDAEALVIDVGSVKGFILASLVEHPCSGRFIGCHPMAGSEKTGYEHSKTGLYRGAQVIITPHEKNSPSDIGRIKAFWELLGASVSLSSAENHDSCVSITSHLPHVLSCGLVEIANRFFKESAGVCEPGPFLGPGFRDMTRLASGSPEMWADICAMNRENIGRDLAKMISSLDELRKLIAKADSDSLRRYFETVRSLKKELE